MSTEKKYYLFVGNHSIPVSYEVYTAYQQTREQEKYYEKKKRKYQVFSYHELGSRELGGEEVIWDPCVPTPEDMVISRITSEQLRHAIETLSEQERSLVQALFFDGITLRALSRKTGVSLNTLKYQRDKILLKLKKVLKK